MRFAGLSWRRTKSWPGGRTVQPQFIIELNSYLGRNKMAFLFSSAPRSPGKTRPRISNQPMAGASVRRAGGSDHHGFEGSWVGRVGGSSEQGSRGRSDTWFGGLAVTILLGLKDRGLVEWADRWSRGSEDGRILGSSDRRSDPPWAKGSLVGRVGGLS